MWRGFRVVCQVDEDVVAPAVGNDDADACLLDADGGGVLRLHAAASGSALLGLDIL